MLISVIGHVPKGAVRVVKLVVTLHGIVFTVLMLALVVVGVWILDFVLELIFRFGLKFPA